MGISLDTNIFISAFDPQNSLHKKSLEVLELTKSQSVSISVLVFQEFLVKIYALGLEKDISQYENFLSANGLFRVIDIDKNIAKLSAKIRSRYPSVKTPDSLHLASAIAAGSKTFFTTEKHLPKKIAKLTIRSIS